MRKKTKNSDLKGVPKEFQVEQQELKQEIAYLKKHLDTIWKHVTVTNERLQALEVQTNLISRLVATLAIEKLGMKTFHLVRLIRRIEKEAVTADQIRDLEDLYNLEHPGDKKKSKRNDSKGSS